MADQHTPPPWHVQPCHGGYLIEGPTQSGVRVVKGSGGVGRPEDARLIAAAPEMLAAIVVALDHLQIGIGHPTQVIDTLRAAWWRAAGQEGA